MNPDNAVAKTDLPQILTLDSAVSLSEAVISAYQDNYYSFNTSPWFIDIDNRFRIFMYNGTRYIAKKARPDKAADEVEKSQNAHNFIDGEIVAGIKFKVIVPKIIAVDADTTYMISEYVGTDMNEMSSYRLVKPLLDAHGYVEIMQFLIKRGITHPGFLPRNIVENGDVMYLFDWEDATFDANLTPADFDRLWYTNFILNWSYLFSRDELESNINALISTSRFLTEPDLVRYERTFRDLIDFKGSTFEMRNLIEQVVFKAEMPVDDIKDESHLHPNDIGHLFADVYFSELDVLNDMSSSLLRTKNKLLYSAIVKLVTQIITLIRKNDLKNIDYYCMVVVLALLSPEDYSANHYESVANQKDLKDICAHLINLNQNSIISLFLTIKLQTTEIDALVRDAVIGATGFKPLENSSQIEKITVFISSLQKEKDE
ncbi:MAG: hypothetical protein JWN28_94 [Candidatus Saccharibacteria bacterium]|nr:hypothetical protein [Candidatus Saccharibacteria bacterium]